MNCLECRDWLQNRMDGAPIASDALEAHLNECATCREQHAAALRVVEALKALPNPKLPADFARSMVAQVIQDRQARQTRIRRRVFVTMALAASVLIVLILAYTWMPRTGTTDPQPKGPLVQDGPKKDAPPKEALKVPEKPEPPSPLAALTNRVAQTTRDHAKVVIAVAPLDGMNNLPAVGELPEAGQEVSDGVRTVTRSARKAFDFFARELPMPDLGEQKN